MAKSAHHKRYICLGLFRLERRHTELMLVHIVFYSWQKLEINDFMLVIDGEPANKYGFVLS